MNVNDDDDKGIVVQWNFVNVSQLPKQLIEIIHEYSLVEQKNKTNNNKNAALRFNDEWDCATRTYTQDVAVRQALRNVKK